ncbi:protein of unknown function [Candidatus Nitrosotalea okcheonensis]|uniref:Uncharacterized protein n=1 Tax=Candidatus Nitrosotalea okcheonensis TaxID=1903276 RepID=A0A2H1FHG3_9ARCH|nr:protein of unknown function [Candidatus Nitrosotalea okcheonensis]
MRSFAKEGMVKYYGISLDKFLLYIKEMELYTTTGTLIPFHY